MIGDSLTVPDQPKTGEARNDWRYLSNSWESWTGEGGRLDIIDYICPKCHQNILYQLHSSSCFHCGTPIFGFPRRKLDAEQRRNWRDDHFEGMKYAGPDKLSRMEAKRKASSGGRPGKGARNK